MLSASWGNSRNGHLNTGLINKTELSEPRCLVMEKYNNTELGSNFIDTNFIKINTHNMEFKALISLPLPLGKDVSERFNKMCL